MERVFKVTAYFMLACFPFIFGPAIVVVFLHDIHVINPQILIKDLDQTPLGSLQR